MVDVRTSVLPTPSEIAHGQSPFGMSYAPGKLRGSSVLDARTQGIREATLTIGTSEWNVNTSARQLIAFLMHEDHVRWDTPGP